jgi:hypothetical protein
MAVISYCDLCGEVISRAETGTAHWVFDDNGVREFVQMCPACIEKVSEFVRSLEEDFTDYTATRYEEVVNED